jgi:hypothetical protein
MQRAERLTQLKSVDFLWVAVGGQIIAILNGIVRFHDHEAARDS